MSKEPGKFSVHKIVEYFNRTMAKPFKSAYKGKALSL